MVAVVAGFGHGVDKAAGRTTELGVEARSHNLKFADGFLRESWSKARTFAAANAAEERIAVIGAVNLDVGVDAALTDQRDLSAVRINIGGRCEQDEILEAAAVDRKFSNRRRVQGRCSLHCRGLNVGGGDLNGFIHRVDLQRNVGVKLRADFDLVASRHELAEALGVDFNLIITDWQQHRAEDAFSVGCKVLCYTCGHVRYLDVRAGDGRPLRVFNRTYNLTGACL